MNDTAERHSLSADAWQSLMGTHATKCRNGNCPLSRDLRNPIKHDDIALEVQKQCIRQNAADDDAKLVHTLAGTCPGGCALP